MDISGGTVVRYGKIIVSLEELTMSEGGNATVDVTLSRAPSEAQTVYLAVSDNTVLSVEPATLTFTSDNWGTAQTITVTALQDENMADEETSVALTSNGSEKIILVTISDDDKVEIATDGLVLHMDYSGLTDYTEDTITDLASGVTFKNLSYFTKLENGIEGDTTYKYLTSINDEAKTSFLEKIKETGGFTLEMFGTAHPSASFRMNGVNVLSNGSAQGYSISNYYQTDFNLLPTRILQDGTSVKTSLDGALLTFTNEYLTAKRIIYFGTDKINYGTDFIHLVMTCSASGEVNMFVNGMKCDSPITIENFKEWDFDSMFGGEILLLCNTNFEPNYVSSQRIYNRVLTDAEVVSNMKTNAMKLSLTTF